MRGMAGRRLGAAGLWADSRAAAALEFAIVSPIYLLMMAGIMAYGIYFGAASSVQQIAADAARAAVAGLSGAERQRIVAQFMANSAGGYVFVDPGKLSYSVGALPGDPDEVRVVVRYDARALPIWNLYVPLPLPRQVITYASTIRIGGA